MGFTEAHALGAIDRIVPAAELLDEAVAFAGRLGGATSEVYAAIKRDLRGAAFEKARDILPDARRRSSTRGSPRPDSGEWPPRSPGSTGAESPSASPGDGTSASCAADAPRIGFVEEASMLALGTLLVTVLALGAWIGARRQAGRTPGAPARLASGLAGTAAVVFAGLTLLQAFTVVPAGHVGVVDFFGTVSDTTLKAGINPVNPSPGSSSSPSRRRS